MLKFSRYLQLAVILVISVVITGCYTVISRPTFQGRYPLGQFMPEDEGGVTSQEVLEEYEGEDE